MYNRWASTRKISSRRTVQSNSRREKGSRTLASTPTAPSVMPNQRRQPTTQQIHSWPSPPSPPQIRSLRLSDNFILLYYFILIIIYYIWCNGQFVFGSHCRGIDLITTQIIIGNINCYYFIRASTSWAIIPLNA